MKLVAYLLLILASFLLIGCNEEPKQKEWNSNTDENNVETNAENFVTDTIVIRNLFDEPDFENDTLLSLLKELDICNPDATAKFDLYKPPCQPRFYKFFKYKEDMPWNDGFALEIRSGVEDFPVRRFIIFERVNGKLSKVQGFVANLAEKHTTPSGYCDLMLLFRDEEAGSFVVKYKWQDNKYEFSSVEAIDGFLVKKDRKDSLSDVVSKRLIDHKMFF